MAFPDFPFHDELPSFFGHEEVRSYLVDYAQHFDLLPFIKVITLSSRTNTMETFKSQMSSWSLLRHCLICS